MYTIIEVLFAAMEDRLTDSLIRNDLTELLVGTMRSCDFGTLVAFISYEGTPLLYDDTATFSPCSSVNAIAATTQLRVRALLVPVGAHRQGMARLS